MPENVFVVIAMVTLATMLLVVIAMVTLATMLLTPFVATDEVAHALARLRPGRQPIGETPSDHILLVGAGSTGMPLLEDLIVHGCRLAVLDDDPGVVGRLRKAGVTAIRGEATDLEALRRAGADRARAVTSMIRRTRDNAALLERARDVPVLVRVFEDDEAEWVRERGGHPVLFSEAAAEALLEWYVDQRDALISGVHKRIADFTGRNSGSTAP